MKTPFKLKVGNQRSRSLEKSKVYGCKHRLAAKSKATKGTMKRVCIIGAGASGLAAIKCCKDEGLEPVCFERTEEIGGLWNYHEELRADGQASVYKSTVINTSKEMMSYSDFPIPREYPIFMHNKDVAKYFQLYADEFGLRKFIQFKKTIVHVKKREDFAKSGQWDVQIRDNPTDETKDLVFDAVLVCTGHHATVHRPTFPGLDKFKGQIIHSHDYKQARGFEDKRIVIIGIGNSGGDAAVELSRVASQVYLSTRRGTWILNRIFDYGLPLDMMLTRRWTMKMNEVLPKWLVQQQMEHTLNKHLDHEAYCLKPDYGPLQQHPMVNDDIANRIITGSVIVKPNVEEFTETGVRFTDGTFEDNIDVVFLATGYIFGFPFLDKEITEVKNNEVTLYKYEFPPDLEQQTLGIIGCIQPLGAIMPIAELQCRLAARVFKGAVKLPDRNSMMENIEEKRRLMAARYVKTQRHTIQVDWIQFMDELAELAGCKPDFKSLLVQDPRLALSCYFGPCTPYQYRLQGPGKWTGARQAIMTQWDRTMAPLKTRPLKLDKKKSQFGFFIFFLFSLVFIAIVVFILSLFM